LPISKWGLLFDEKTGLIISGHSPSTWRGVTLLTLILSHILLMVATFLSVHSALVRINEKLLERKVVAPV
jgi:hypothetical protein